MKREAGSRDRGAGNREHRTGIGEQGAGNIEHRTGIGEQGAGNIEHRTGIREQGLWNREYIYLLLLPFPNLFMGFHEDFKIVLHNFNKEVYRLSKLLPREELYGATSQLRRASMSVVLNYIEGYARRKGLGCKVFKNFVETSYGSLKEVQYLLYFSNTENWISQKDYNSIFTKSDEIGAVLYRIIKNS